MPGAYLVITAALCMIPESPEIEDFMEPVFGVLTALWIVTTPAAVIASTVGLKLSWQQSALARVYKVLFVMHGALVVFASYLCFRLIEVLMLSHHKV